MLPIEAIIEMETNDDNMKKIFQRFPHLGTKILRQLDNKSLNECLRVNKCWASFIQIQRFPYIKKIQNIRGTSCDLKDDWKIMKKMTINNLKSLLKGINNFPKKCKNIDCCRINISQGHILSHIESSKVTTLDLVNLSPLHVSAASGMLDLSQFILNNSENKNPENKELNTPLHLAAVNGEYDVFILIIENLSNKNPANKYGDTPYHFAARKGDLLICNAIIDKIEDDKNPANLDGNTPLHIAACYGKLEVCKLLVCKMGLEKNIQNNSGRTPWSLVSPSPTELLKGKGKVLKFFSPSAYYYVWFAYIWIFFWSLWPLWLALLDYYGAFQP